MNFNSIKGLPRWVVKNTLGRYLKKLILTPDVDPVTGEVEECIWVDDPTAALNCFDKSMADAVGQIWNVSVPGYCVSVFVESETSETSTHDQAEQAIQVVRTFFNKIRKEAN